MSEFDRFVDWSKAQEDQDGYSPMMRGTMHKVNGKSYFEPINCRECGGFLPMRPDKDCPKCNPDSPESGGTDDE